MKTKLFLAEKLDEENIEKLKTIQIAKEELYNVIKEWFLLQKEYPRINKKLTTKFAEDTGFNAEEVIRTFKSIFWLNRMMVEYENDSPEDILDDLKSINPDIIIIEETLLDRIKGVKEIAAKFKLLVKSERTKGYGAPTLSGSSSCVILKPVIEERFDFDTQNIKDYKPQIIKTEPCVLIELEDSNEKFLSFQMDSDNFERFLNDMIALQIELNSVKNDSN